MPIMSPTHNSVTSCLNVLLRLLKVCGFSPISVEDFKLSKSNNPKTRKPMFRLLYELVYFLNYKTVDHICREGYERFSFSDVVTYVRNQLSKKGFSGHYFDTINNELPHSRDSLLAVAWLLLRCNLTEHLEDHLLASTSCVFPTQPSKENTSNFHTCERSLAHLLWITGKFRTKLKHLYQLRIEVLNAFEQLCKSGSSISGACPLDCWLRTDPKALLLRINELEEANENIELLLTWKTGSECFWSWINSILEANFLDSNLAIPGTCSESATSQQCIENVARLHAALDETLYSYNSLMEKLENRLLGVVPADITEQSLSNLLSCLDEDILLFEQQLYGFGITPLSPTAYPLSFPLLSDGKKQSNACGSNSKLALTLDLDTETKKLEAVLSTLKSKYQNSKSIIEKHLQGVSRVVDPSTLYLYDPTSFTKTD